MFYEIACAYKKPFSIWKPFPSIADTTSFCALPTDWKEKTLLLGESYLGFSYPYLSAADFMEFSRTGNRTHFEDRFFSKRIALNSLILAEGVEGNKRFLDDIVNGIFAICDENSWCLPPHNSYIRDTPQLPLPDLTAPVLDLFACETGAILATAYSLLSEVFDEISPAINKRILYELSRRVFIPYETFHFWWMGDGIQPMNNWTIWCTQNVLLSAFLTSQDDDLLRRILLKASKSCDYFLAEYGEDGCCDEGAQYYRHAGLCLFGSIEILNAVTNGAFDTLYQVPKIQNIATYIFHAHIDDKYYINFADCSPVAGRCSAREYLFAKRIDNQDMMNFAATDFFAGGEDSLLLPNENNLFYRLQNAFAASEIRSFDRSHPIVRSDVYYPSVGLFLLRDSTFTLGVKAGDNADSHNHNDTGSFTIYKNGRPLFIDIGVESYTKKTFSPERYEIWTMQSAYHNLPTINGCMQLDGEAYKASNLDYQLHENRCEIEMDLAKAYPKDCGLASYRRHVIFEKGKQIQICDTVSMKEDWIKSNGSPEIILNLMTYEKYDPCFEGGKLLSQEEIRITDPRLKKAWDHSVFRTQILFLGNRLTLTIS